MFNRKPIIEFFSVNPAFDHVAKPGNSRKFFPDWIKRLKMTSKFSGGQRIPPNAPELDTVRKCAPFLDVMRAGYIIPAPADMWFKITNNGGVYNTDYRTSLNLDGSAIELISEHVPEQLGSEHTFGKLALKFNNPWLIKTRPGYSCLFTSPFNHNNKYFECFSGVVDTDNYGNIINFPFRLLNSDNKDTWEFTIKRGDPLIQIIPFKRFDVYGKIKVTKASAKQWKKLNCDHDLVSGNFSWYREKINENKITLEK